MDPIEKQDTPASSPESLAGGRETAAPAIDYGPNNENLPKDHQEALHRLVTELMDDDSQARREYVKRVKRMHMYYRGEQYIYWDAPAADWRIPSPEQIVKAKQPFRFVTNIVRPYGHTLMAALSSSVPKVRFWPQSPQQEDDVATADAASVMAEHIQRVNRMERLVIDESFYLCFDGVVGGYVRWVADADRFGTRTKPVVEPVEKEIAPGHYVCTGCGAAQDAMGLCPTCGYPVTEADFVPPVSAVVPSVTGEEEVPNAQVVIDMVGAMNLKFPILARDMKDYGYLAYVTEVPIAKVQAVHAHVAEKLGKGGDLGSVNDTPERQERISLASGRRGNVAGGDEQGSVLTYHRIWLRPWTFRRIKDPKIREDFETLFPTGCRVNFADDVYCESVEASMDDHWRIQHVTSGDGQARDPLLWDLLSVQDRLNTLKNLGMETYQHGIPTLFMDRDRVNVKAWADSGSRPGSGIGVRGRPGQALSQLFHETAPAQMSRDAINEGHTLMAEDSQFISGGYPALLGAGAMNTETASGLAMQRDQAMGRLGMVFRQQREFHSELLTIAVEEMKRHITQHDPVQIALLGPEGPSDTKTIRLENLSGHYLAYPEADETFPETFSQKKQSLMAVIESKAPIIDEALASPNAKRYLWRMLGIRDFQLPGEVARQRQFREIQELLKAAPLPGVPQPQVDPMSGAVVGMVPGPEQPSVPVDVDFDDHATHLATISEWIEGPPGIEASLNNPAGYANVRAHGLAHKAALEAQVAAQMAAQAPPAPPPEAPA